MSDLKLDELKVADEYRFQGQKCLLLAAGDPRGQEGSIELVSGDVFKLTVVGRVYSFRLESGDKALIADLLNRGFKNICTVSNYHDKAHSEVFVIDVVFFSGSARMGDLNIYISDKVKEQLVRKRMVDAKKADKPEAYAVFAESFMFKDGAIPCFAYTDGKYPLPETPAGDGDRFSQAPEQDEDAEQETTQNASDQVATEGTDKASDNVSAKNTKEEELKKHRALKIYGKDCILFVRADGTGDQVRLIAEKVTFSKQNIPCMKLAHGKVSFGTEATFVAGEVKRILQESPGYIELWNTYAKLEGEFLLRRARSIDTLDFKDPVLGSDGTVTLFFSGKGDDEAVIIEGKLKHFKEGDMVNLGWIPVYLQDTDMSWDDYKQLPSMVRSGGVSLGDYFAVDKSTRFTPVKRESAKVLKTTSDSITLEWQNSSHLPQSPLSLSILGDEKQILRREQARERIENGESANPQLGLIIDGNSLSSPHKGSNVKPLSEYVRNKIFPQHPPTDNQILAIDIALNTPDIAVIQGPPGTGKTTVIKAIIERLNETGRKKDYEAGSVLVTSLQHDAVYNVSKALDINGLPTIKFGTRKRDGDSAEQAWDRDAREWCSKVVEHVLEKNPQLMQSMQQSELRGQLQLYLSSPDDDKAKALLEQFRMLPISNELAEKVNEMLKELDSSGTEDTDEQLAAIRRLRITKRGFLDDGQANAMSLYRRLSDLGFAESGDEENKDILSVLRKAAMTPSPEKELLKDIKRIRDILLERCLPPPFYSTPSINDEFVELANEVISSLDRGEDQKDCILREYVSELTRNPEAIKTTVQSYNFVFAATAQQSMGTDVCRAKNISSKDIKDGTEFPKYDTVIVDEAARVTPADLMIPMSQAKRRIIFVGDHRQLPHIYDEEIFEEMQNSGEVEHEENIKISMFQHLLKSAKQLEKSDGIIRTAVLNNQYRTHPLLGNFVNECFYKPNDEAFNSPLKADLFTQPICKSPLRWVDISASRGVEERLNTSRCRTVEIDYIAEKLKEYLAREDCSRLTFGVITFYSAQVAKLRKRMGALADDPRVRIGSVDSFQGMEFDVVFLSVVRTSGKRITVEDAELVRRLRAEKAANGTLCEKSEKEKENLGMRYYGFLTSENRLCVALSRQKRLLIVVGDKDLFTRNNYAELARLCVPAMHDLYDLASREGEIING